MNSNNARRWSLMLATTACLGGIVASGCSNTQFASRTGKKNDATQNSIPTADDTPKDPDTDQTGKIPATTATVGATGTATGTPGTVGGNTSSATTGSNEGGGTSGNGTATTGIVGTDGSNSEGPLSETDTVLNPQMCDTVTSGKVVHVGEKCPESYALYTMDDMGSHDSVPGSYACCPLPARDILLASGAFQSRYQTCQADEVMTGAIDTSGNIYCSKINTVRYALRVGTVAYTGSGSGGAGGAKVSQDSLPPTLRALVIGPLGSDGCIAMPFGSLMTKQGGKRCTDTSSATLYEISTNAPVKMFPGQ